MTNRNVFDWFLILNFVCSAALADEQANQIDTREGTVRSVTLYRDRALVSREIPLPSGDSQRTINVPNLPEGIVPDSVFAEGDEQVVIRAVRVSPRTTVESNREEVRELQRRIVDLQKQQMEIQLRIDGYSNDLDTLDQMVDLSANLGKSDLQRGVLDAETLISLANFSMTKRRELSTERLKFQHDLDSIGKELSRVTTQKDIATRGKRTLSYEATIFLETGADVAGTFHLSYLVGNCGWSPQYTVRGRIEKDSIELRYSALVQQMSGENWNDVNLTLSTASPNVSASRPGLTPLRVASADPAELDQYTEADDEDPFGNPGSAYQSAKLAQMIDFLHERQKQVEYSLDNGFSADSPLERDAALNGLAGHMQEIELQAEAKSWRTIAPGLKNESASQVYALAKTVSLVSRRENQLVQILETELAGEMYHVATPLLSTYAYREAQMTNAQPLGLLQGPASVYLNDRLVGRMQIPSTASGQRLVIGFGADQQVRTRRELIDKLDELQGGNRQLKFVYKLVISNFKDKAITVRLIDRIPNTQQSQQLSVKLDDPQRLLSDDGLYQRVEKSTGMLRWDLQVPAGKHGSDALDVQYSFTMEFDRNRIPTMQDALADLQAEFDTKFRSGGGGFGGGGMGGGVFNVPDAK